MTGTTRTLLNDITSPETLQRLENANIEWQDLLFTDSTRPRTVANQLQLKSDELAELRVKLAGKLSASAIRATDDYANAILTIYVPLNSGVAQIDRLLSRRDTTPAVIEISGAKASGKTTLAIQLSLHLLLDHPDAHVLWIDTLGAFAANRADSVLEVILHDHNLPKSVEFRNSILSRLQVAYCFDMKAFQSTIDSLDEHVNRDSATGNLLRLVVIDSITPIFLPYLQAVSAQGHSVMTSQLQRLKLLSRKHHFDTLARFLFLSRRFLDL